MIQHAPARIVALNGPCHRVHPGHAQYLLVRGLGGGRFKRWPTKKWLPYHAPRDALEQTDLGCFGTKTPSGRCQQVCPDVRIGRLRFLCA